MQNDEAQKALSLANVTNRVRFNSSQGFVSRCQPMSKSITDAQRPKMDVPKPHGPPAGFARRGLSREGLEPLLRVSMTKDALLAQARRPRAKRAGWQVWQGREGRAPFSRISPGSAPF